MLGEQPRTGNYVSAMLFKRYISEINIFLPLLVNCLKQTIRNSKKSTQRILA